MSRVFLPTARRAILTTWLVMSVIIALSLSASAYGDFKSLSQRLPASSNAIVAANVAKLLDTPYAKSEWSPNTVEEWAKQPLMIPPHSKRLLMAAEVKTDSMDSLWEMSLMEMAHMPTVKQLAEAEGGNIDRLWDKDGVASPINAYFIPLDGQVLASITPANRAMIAKWVRQPVKPEGYVTSAYLKNVLARLGDETDIVMAIDLEGAFGVPRIRKWLDLNEIKEIKDDQLDAVANTLNAMKGVTLDITVDKDVTGKGVVEFERDASLLKDCAKPVMIAVLNSAGMRIEDIEQWTFTTSGKQITMQGKISTPGLRRLMSIVQSPIPAAVAQQPAGDQGKPPASPAEASQRYFKVICGNLDNFGQATSASETATYARATSKRIDQLPILNVDPALVEWGGMVSLKLKQAGATMGIGQTQMNARVAGVLDPTYDAYTYDSDGNYQSAARTNEAANVARQRRQAALEQKAQAQQQAVQIISEIGESRAKIRAMMVEKYKVEF